MKKNIAVMFGGQSLEHEISIITALQTIHAFDPLKYNIIPAYISQEGKWYTGKALTQKSSYANLKKTLKKSNEIALLPDPSIKGLILINKKNKVIPIDVYFLSFHGQSGEDGCIQGLLELTNSAYTGCDVLASAMTMNKYYCKTFLKEHKINVLPSLLISRRETRENLNKTKDHILSKYEFPFIVKPCNLGSSIGITKVTNEQTLISGLSKVFKYDSFALLEPYINNLLEVNISILGNQKTLASVVEIPVPTKEILTYEDKYLRGGSKKQSLNDVAQDGMAGLTRSIDPKDLKQSIKKEINAQAKKIFKLLNCNGLARLDFIIDPETEQIYFNELNPIPGSFAYYLWEKNSPPLLYTEFIDEMIVEAEEIRAEKTSLQKNFGVKTILN